MEVAKDGSWIWCWSAEKAPIRPVWRSLDYGKFQKNFRAGKKKAKEAQEKIFTRRKSQGGEERYKDDSPRLPGAASAQVRPLPQGR